MTRDMKNTIVHLANRINFGGFAEQGFPSPSIYQDLSISKITARAITRIQKKQSVQYPFLRIQNSHPNPKITEAMRMHAKF